MVKRTLFRTGADVAAFNAKVAKMATSLKWASRILKVTEFSAILASFATLIAETVIAHNVRRDLRAAIREMVPIRFQVKLLEMHGRVWDQFQLNITAAADTWVTLQEMADGGVNCYVDADIELAKKVDEATVDMIDAFAAITNETVYARLREEDLRSNNGDPWLHDEPTYEQILAAVYDDGAAVSAEDQAAADSEVAASNNVAPLDPAAVNATNCRYVELTDNKGALWKLSGPFWSYQEGPGPGPGPGGSSGGDGRVPTVRHRLRELERTDSEVRLQLVSTDADSSVEPLPLAINLPAATINFNGVETAIDASQNSNLVPTNGWNAYFVPLNATAPGAADDVFTNAFECNRVAGWKLTWSNSWGGGFSSDLLQQYRDKVRVWVSAQKRNGDLRDPSANVDLGAATMHVVDAIEGIDQTFAVFEDGVLPRTTID